MPVRVPFLAVVALTAVLVVTGCGGGGSSSTVTTIAATASGDGLTKTEWITKADAICEGEEEKNDGFAEEFNAAGGEPASKARTDKLVELAEIGIEVGERHDKALRELPPPSGDRELIEEIIRASEQRTVLTGELGDAFREENATQEEEVAAKLRQANGREVRLERGYGLEVCGSEE